MKVKESDIYTIADERDFGRYKVRRVNTDQFSVLDGNNSVVFLGNHSQVSEYLNRGGSHGNMINKTGLVLVFGNEFRGIVGDYTGVVSDLGEDVCIGDKVEVKEEHGIFTGVVAVFTDKYSIMGLSGKPLSEFRISRIVSSYKDLIEGSYLWDLVNFKVIKWIGSGY